MVHEIAEKAVLEQNPIVKVWLEEKRRKSKQTASQYLSQFYNYSLWLKEKRYSISASSGFCHYFFEYFCV
jgi:hypothetical protein